MASDSRFDFGMSPGMRRLAEGWQPMEGLGPEYDVDGTPTAWRRQEERQVEQQRLEQRSQERTKRVMLVMQELRQHGGIMVSRLIDDMVKDLQDLVVKSEPLQYKLGLLANVLGSNLALPQVDESTQIKMVREFLAQMILQMLAAPAPRTLEGQD